LQAPQHSQFGPQASQQPSQAHGSQPDAWQLGQLAQQFAQQPQLVIGFAVMAQAEPKPNAKTPLSNSVLNIIHLPWFV
jgi:hypothetical protein